MDNFIPIRNGLLEHIRQGKLCPTDLGIYTYLHLTADWATGVCRTCAAGIAVQFDDPKLVKLVQRSLQRLRASGYINYRPGDGQRGLYPILLNKYEPTVGGLCGRRLSAFAAGSLDSPVYEPKNGRETEEGTEERPILDYLDFQDKPLGRKAPRRAQTDPRFTPTRERLHEAFYQVCKSPGKPPWGGHCAKELTEWLKSDDLPQPEIDALIANVCASENAKQLLLDPARLIPHLRKYAVPLDRYGKPIPGVKPATPSKPRFDLSDASPSKANPESVKLLKKYEAAAQQEAQEAAVAAAGAKC